MNACYFALMHACTPMCRFTTGSDETIHVWDLSSRPARIKVLTGHRGVVHSLAVHNRKLYSKAATIAHVCM